jgi:hypothetical protein
MMREFDFLVLIIIGLLTAILVLGGVALYHFW